MELICAYAPALEVWSATLAGQPPRLAPRERTRTIIAGGLMLSVPIAGGAATVKRSAPGSWLLSDHGRWPHLHFEALRAAYGRTPYFAHLAPRLEAIYTNLPERFCELTGQLDAELLDFIQFEQSWPRIMELRDHDAELYSALRRERAAEADFSLSVLDAMFRFGPEAIFFLAPAL